VVFDLFEHIEEIVFSDEPDLGPILQDLLPTQRTEGTTPEVISTTQPTEGSTAGTTNSSPEMTTEVISTTKPTEGSTAGTTSSSPAHLSSILIIACTLVALFSNY